MEYDGNIKLGVSVKVDSSDVSSQMNKFNKDIFLQIDKANKELTMYMSKAQAEAFGQIGFEKLGDLYANVGKDAAVQFLSNFQSTLASQGLDAAQKVVSDQITPNIRPKVLDPPESHTEYKELIDYINQLKATLRTGLDSDGTVLDDRLVAQVVQELEMAKKELAEMQRPPEVQLPSEQKQEQQQQLSEYQQLVQQISQLQTIIRSGISTDGTVLDNQQIALAVAELENAKKKLAEIQKPNQKEQINNMQRLKSVIGGVGKAALGAGTAVKTMGGGIKNAASRMKQLGRVGEKGVNTLRKGFKKTFGNVLRLGFGMRSLFFLIRRIRTAAIESLKTIAKAFPEFNKDMSELKTSIAGLKASLGTALQPLISMLLPTINQIILRLTEAINKVGEFFASFSGQGYIYKATAAQQDFAKATDKVNQKLGDYDNLKVIGQEENNFEPSYSKQSVAGTMNDFANMLKDAWEKADFTDVGRVIGEKFKKMLTNVQDNLIPKADEFAQKFMSSIATAINGFTGVDGLASSIGDTLALAVNTAINGINTFVATTDWYQVGKFLGDGIYNFLLNIDWERIGEAAANGFNALKDFIVGIFDRDWSEIGKDIGKGFESFKEKLNFGTLGDDISNVFQNVFDNVTTKLLPSLFSTIANLFSPLVTFLHPVIEIVMKIADVVSNWASKIFPNLAGVIGAILEMLTPIWEIVDVLLSTILEVLDPIISSLGDNFLPTLRDLFTNILQPITELLTKVVVPVLKVVAPILKAIGGVVGWLIEVVSFLMTIVNKIFDSIVNKIKSGGIKNALKSALNVIITLLNGLIDGLNAIVTPFRAIIMALGNVFGQKWTMDTIKIPHIPKLAQGAVLPANKPFLAMVGDQKSGTNVEAPLETIRQALREELAITGGGNNQTIVLQLDGRTVAKVVWDENQKRYKQLGHAPSYA